MLSQKTQTKFKSAMINIFVSFWYEIFSTFKIFIISCLKLITLQKSIWLIHVYILKKNRCENLPNSWYSLIIWKKSEKIIKDPNFKHMFLIKRIKIVFAIKMRTKTKLWIKFVNRIGFPSPFFERFNKIREKKLGLRKTWPNYVISNRQPDLSKLN